MIPGAIEPPLALYVESSAPFRDTRVLLQFAFDEVKAQAWLIAQLEDSVAYGQRFVENLVAPRDVGDHILLQEEVGHRSHDVGRGDGRNGTDRKSTRLNS